MRRLPEEAFHQPAPSVGQLVRRAPMLALAEAARAAHDAGDAARRDALCDTYFDAAALGIGCGRPGLAAFPALARRTG